MADIELVIRISEEDYKTLVNINDSRLPSIIAREHLFNAIAIGTPLPKGHGDLIDRDVAREAMMFEMNGTGYQSRAVDVLRRDIYTPTIIEADEGE